MKKLFNLFFIMVAMISYQPSSIGQNEQIDKPKTINEQELSPIKLNTYELNKGKTVMQALKNRKSEREFSNKELSLQHLSELLWAANGVNREDGGRTAPSAFGKNTVDVYVVLQKNVYLYEPKKHQLLPIVESDYFLKYADMQNPIHTAPITLVYVADLNKLNDPRIIISSDEKLTFACIDAGHKAENVYLYCASEELVTTTQTSINKEKLFNAMKLHVEQKIILIQKVGYPK